jgi:hypothetical protein
MQLSKSITIASIKLYDPLVSAPQRLRNVCVPGPPEGNPGVKVVPLLVGQSAVTRCARERRLADGEAVELVEIRHVGAERGVVRSDLPTRC